MSTPPVSMVVIVKNGMPFIRQAIESLAKQDWSEFEVVVQDAASTDGTTEYLQSVKGLDLRIDSRPDKGQAHAYNRGFERCRGKIIGTVDADNWLEPRAISTALRTFETRPDAAAVYGSFNAVDEGGNFVEVFNFPPFDRMSLITNTLVPPFGASFFNREACGNALFSDESIKHCQDFGIWLRLSDKTILQIDDVLCSVRSSPKSETCNIQFYDRFCFHKCNILDDYLTGIGSERLRKNLRRIGRAGIYCWAAESALILAGEGDDYRRFRNLVAHEDQGNVRLLSIEHKLRNPALRQ
jgi:glycosyltransferase involved in cell wall biosynthesis